MSKTVLISVTPEEVLKSSRNEYNYSAWISTVGMYRKFSNVKFYRQDGPYERYFVSYNVDKINFFKEVSYVSCMSAGGCRRIMLEPISEDGESYSVSFGSHIYSKDNDGRKVMRVASAEFAYIFTDITL